MLGSPVRGRTERCCPGPPDPAAASTTAVAELSNARPSVASSGWLYGIEDKESGCHLLAFQTRSVVTRAAEAPLFTVSWIDPDVLLISGSSELLLLVALPVSSLLSLGGLLETERTHTQLEVLDVLCSSLMGSRRIADVPVASTSPCRRSHADRRQSNRLPTWCPTRPRSPGTSGFRRAGGRLQSPD